MFGVFEVQYFGVRSKTNVNQISFAPEIDIKQNQMSWAIDFVLHNLIKIYVSMVDIILLSM